MVRFFQDFSHFIEELSDQELFLASLLCWPRFETTRNSLCFWKPNNSSEIQAPFHYQWMHDPAFFYANFKWNADKEVLYVNPVNRYIFSPLGEQSWPVKGTAFSSKTVKAVCKQKALSAHHIPLGSLGCFLLRRQDVLCWACEPTFCWCQWVIFDWCFRRRQLKSIQCITSDDSDVTN